MALTAVAALAALAAAAPAASAGTKLTVRDSEFGRMVWAPGKQAAYFFARDRGRGAPTCYGGCARAWPPVFTRGKPVAGAGVRPGLLGTVRRRGGARQVTYGGKPLYTYAHEGPDQVLCHDVFLNGGFWWAIGPGGRRLP